MARPWAACQNPGFVSGCILALLQATGAEWAGRELVRGFLSLAFPDSHMQHVCIVSAHLCCPCAPVVAEDRRQPWQGRAARVRSPEAWKEGMVCSDPGSSPASLDLFSWQDCNCSNDKSHNPGDVMHLGSSRHLGEVRSL